MPPRIPVTVTNLNKAGKLSTKWHVRIGAKWETFDEEKWKKVGGVKWIINALKLAGVKGRKNVG